MEAALWRPVSPHQARALERQPAPVMPPGARPLIVAQVPVEAAVV